MKFRLESKCLLVYAFCYLTQIYAQVCQTPCSCPWVPPRCPPGVPLIMDGCGCCRICARRLGEACNHIYLCDQSQELLCDLSTSANGREGTCNYNYDGSCEIDGKVYKDGETFEPSCKFQCQCQDGGVICTPLCSEDIQLPTPECPSPRRIEIPGKCCQEWICEDQRGQLSDNHINGAIIPNGSPHNRPFLCPEWSTEWGACSTSCGMGFSMRVSNKNPHCRLETQSRLCMVRPCGQIMSNPQNVEEMSPMTPYYVGFVGKDYVSQSVESETYLTNPYHNSSRVKRMHYDCTLGGLKGHFASHSAFDFRKSSVCAKCRPPSSNQI